MLNTIKGFIKKLRKTAKTLFKSGRRMEGCIEVSSMTVDWTQQGSHESVVGSSIWTFESNSNSTTATPEMSDNSYKTVKPKDERIQKKPVDIWNEIISEIPKIDLVNIDKKIEVVRKRKEFLVEHMNVGASDEKQALSWLEARKKFPKYAHMFKWATTNMDAINTLCKKYKVQMVGFGGYYKSIPNEAIDELEAYCEIYAKITKDKPIFKLIIDDGGTETKKDPILLACSPFGKWFYILGAWDKEVEFVDELVYGAKK